MLEVKLNMENDRTRPVKITSLFACGVFTVSFRMASVFEVKINYGVGFATPLSPGFALPYLTLLILQFSFATLAIRSGTINLDLHSSTQRSSELTIGLNEQLPADLFGILFDSANDSFRFHS